MKIIMLAVSGERLLLCWPMTCLALLKTCSDVAGIAQVDSCKLGQCWEVNLIGLPPSQWVTPTLVVFKMVHENCQFFFTFLFGGHSSSSIGSTGRARSGARSGLTCGRGLTDRRVAAGLIGWTRCRPTRRHAGGVGRRFLANRRR